MNAIVDSATPHSDWITQVSSNAQQRLASGSFDGTLAVHDIQASLKSPTAFFRLDGTPLALEWVPEQGTRLLSFVCTVDFPLRRISLLSPLYHLLLRSILAGMQKTSWAFRLKLIASRSMLDVTSAMKNQLMSCTPQAKEVTSSPFTTLMLTRRCWASMMGRFKLSMLALQPSRFVLLLTDRLQLLATSILILIAQE